MWTSRNNNNQDSVTRSPSQRIMMEASLAGVLASALAVLISSSDPWLTGSSFHPAWFAVMAMAAFYGLRGLLIGAPIVWSVVALCSAAVGSDVVGISRLATGADLMLLISSLSMAAIGMVQNRFRFALEVELGELRNQQEEDSGLLDSLQKRVLGLRARCERIDLNVRFWRHIANRLESMGAREAADAALEMCMVRTGARAGIVRHVEDGGLRNLAWRGQWSKERQLPRDIFADATIAAALQTKTTVLASELSDVSPEDSDVAVAICSPTDGRVLGVLALRGQNRSQLDSAALQDISSMADWLTVSMSAGEDLGDPQISESDKSDFVPRPTKGKLFLVGDES